MQTSLIKNLGNQKSWVRWECRRLDEDVDFTQRFWVYGKSTRKRTQPSGLDYGAGKDKALFAGNPNSWWKHTSAYRYFRNSFSGQHWRLSPKPVLCALLSEITVSPPCFQVVWRSLGGRYRCTDGFQGWEIAEYTLCVKISSLSISHRNMGFVVASAGWVGKQYKVPPGLQGRIASFQSPPTTWEGVQTPVSAVSAAPSRKSHQRQHLPVPASSGDSCVYPWSLTLFSVLLWEGQCRCGKGLGSWETWIQIPPLSFMKVP